MSESISTVEQLVAAREARGLSPEDVLRQLKLAPRQLRAIETADWQALPGTAFTRAVLRSYGRVLGADVEPLLASLSPSMQSTDLRPASSLDTPLPAHGMLGFGSGGGGSRLAWVALVLLAVVALALFFGGGADLSNVRSWLSELRGSTAPQAPADGGEAAGSRKTPGLTTESVPLGGVALPPASGPAAPAPAGGAASGSGAPQTAASAASAAAPASTPAAGPSAPAPSAAPATATATATASAAAESSTGAQAPGAAPAAAEAPRGHTLRLRFERESWIEVKAADGTVLVSGTQQAQSSREISGAGPLSLIIGNAEFVRAEVDGKSFDLAPHTRATIARVRIP